MHPAKKYITKNNVSTTYRLYHTLSNVYYDDDHEHHYHHSINKNCLSNDNLIYPNKLNNMRMMMMIMMLNVINKHIQQLLIGIRINLSLRYVKFKKK
jgi:hypothetical protein